MEKNKAEQIITSYVPPQGCINLSKKPDSLTEVQYAKILDMQQAVMHAVQGWQRLSGEQREIIQERATALRQMIRVHWGIEFFSKAELSAF